MFDYRAGSKSKVEKIMSQCGERQRQRQTDRDRGSLCCAFTGAGRVPWGNTRLFFADRMLSNHLSRSLILRSAVISGNISDRINCDKRRRRKD